MPAGAVYQDTWLALSELPRHRPANPPDGLETLAGPFVMLPDALPLRRAARLTVELVFCCLDAVRPFLLFGRDVERALLFEADVGLREDFRPLAGPVARVFLDWAVFTPPPVGPL